jgi:hypothetical protein
MSYISAIQPTHAAAMPRLPHQQASSASVDQPADIAVPPAARLSTGLELVVLLTTLSGLSLVLCTIIAGAF